MRGRLILLCTAQFVDVLDVNAVLVALPAIGRDLGLRGGALSWVVTAYVLVFGGCLLAAGRLADALGRRRVFALGLTAFTAASLACSLAPSAAVLVPGRAVQGLGAALTAPSALALIVDGFPAGRPRERAVAAWTGVAAVGGAAGLVLGGLIVGALGWRWVFLVNVPVGVAALALTPRLVAESGRARTEGLDVPGALAATAGLGLLVAVLQQAGSAGLPLVLALAGGAAVLLAVFAARERAAVRPLLPPALLRRPGLAAALLAAALLTATTSGGAVLATLQLQDVLGLGPAAAGVLLLPLSVAVVAGSAAATRVRAPARALIAGGLALVAAGSVVPALTAGRAGLVAWGATAGLGLGAASVAATTLGASAVGDADRGTTAGLLNTAAQVGTALGVAALVLVAGTASGTPGHRLGFAAAAAVALAGLLALAVLLRRSRPRAGASSCAAARTPEVAAGRRSEG